MQLSLNILKNTEAAILYELPPGKPDPEQKCVLGIEQRDRILQKAETTNACWHAVFNYIRPRIGHYPCEELIEARKVEERCSQRKKELMEHERSLPELTDQIAQMSETFKRITKERAPLFIQRIPKEMQEEINPLFEQFIVSRFNTLFDYLIDLKFGKRNQINTAFLKEHGKRPEELFQELRKRSPELRASVKSQWNELSVADQSGLIDGFVRKLTAELYGLKLSSWNPREGISRLVKELKEKGPLSTAGIFGKTVYTTEAAAMKKLIGGREIYCWPKGSRKEGISIIAHSILIVGAEKTGKRSFVYYIDPSDPSDPNDRTRQKIYITSWETFTANQSDINGVLGDLSASCYSYYGNFSNCALLSQS